MFVKHTYPLVHWYIGRCVLAWSERVLTRFCAFDCGCRINLSFRLRAPPPLLLLLITRILKVLTINRSIKDGHKKWTLNAATTVVRICSKKAMKQFFVHFRRQKRTFSLKLMIRFYVRNNTAIVWPVVYFRYFRRIKTNRRSLVRSPVRPG
jgi:hypothetical protein